MARQQSGNPTQSATQPPQYQQEPSQPGQQGQPASGSPSGADRERQRAVTREGTPGMGPGSAPGTGVQRGDRPGMTTAGLGATSPSLLPAFMARPDLMAGAFMSNPFAFAQAMSQEMDRLFGLASGEATSPYERTGAGTPGRALAGGRQQGLQQGLQGYQGYPGAAQRWAPQLEVFQRGNELVVRADLPGMRPDDVQIDVEDGVLTISGERREENEDRERGFYRSERSYGAFSRSIALPEDVDEDRVQARYEHGVLEVTVPMPPQQAKRGRRVEIQSGASGSVAGARNTGTEGTRSTGTEGARPNA